MYRRQMPRKDFRHARIGRPAMIARMIPGKRPPRRFGIAHSVNLERQLGRPRGGEQKVRQFLRALAVAPVADPDKALAVARPGRWAEQQRVGSLVHGPDAITPAPAAVDLGPRPPRSHTPLTNTAE